MIDTVLVVTPEEMSRVEKAACFEGCSEEHFMERAGKGIADRTEIFIAEKQLDKTVIIVAGKGNNGGDGYVAGRHLLGKGFRVEVISPYEEYERGKLCALQADRFLLAGGKIRSARDPFVFPSRSVIVDALFGTGFRGSVTGACAEMVNLVNESGLPVIAVDIPSGLCAASGTVGSVAVQATVTVYLECPKTGFFLEEGPNYTGDLQGESFDLPEKYREQLIGKARLVESLAAKKFFPRVVTTRNKYSRGVVLALAGSSFMPGAGILTSYAALRSGAGMVKWFYLGSGNRPDSIPHEILAFPFEESEERFFLEEKRARAVAIGPGAGRDSEAEQALCAVLTKTILPCVIDADALFFLSQNSEFPIPPGSILTPHRGELQKLLEGAGIEGDFWQSCEEYVRRKKTTLLVKGAPNFVFSEGSLPYILPVGNPGMATGGSGDVLTGITAALLAQKIPAVEAAILGIYLHGAAGDYAEEKYTSYCMTASDIIAGLPEAFAAALRR